MPSPLHIIAGLWLATSPALTGHALVSALAAPAATRADSRVPDSPAALLTLSDEELARRIEDDPASIGSLSIGKPGSARLFNAVQLQSTVHWQVAPNADAWGTAETIDAIATVVDKVFELFPDSPPLTIGDISSRDGGRLKRHESHQGGRDVDFGFFYTNGKSNGFIAGTPSNMDLARNWALLRALVTCTDVQSIFLDTRIQRSLYKYALSISEDKEWLDHVFGFARGYRDAIVQHIAGHRNHYHVRFYNPIAQEMGRRAQPILVEMGLMKPPTYTVRHVVRQGQTLGEIARRYGVSVQAIKQANALTSERLRAGRAYRIPVRAAIAPGEPLIVPRRLLPPATPPELSGTEWPTPDTLYGENSALTASLQTRH